jgi:hypothetical protein
MRSKLSKVFLLVFYILGKGAWLNCGYLQSKIFGRILIGQRSQRQKSASFIKGSLPYLSGHRSITGYPLRLSISQSGLGNNENQTGVCARGNQSVNILG